MKTVYCLSIIAALFTLAAPAAEEATKKEESPLSGPEKKFIKLDVDQNGSLSEEEFLTPFNRYKTNMAQRDDMGDRLAMMEEKMIEQFKAKDVDGDGKLSKEEYIGAKPAAEAKTP